jgi:hypothetical protein
MRLISVQERKEKLDRGDPIGSRSRRRRTVQQKQGQGGGGFSCQQCRCFDAVTADATVPLDLVVKVALVARVSGRIRPDVVQHPEGLG